MRLIGKLLALPFVIVTGILYLFCKFLVVVSGAVLGILSGIVFLAALALFFAAGFWPGMSRLVIAFLISPYSLPLEAAGIEVNRERKHLRFRLSPDDRYTRCDTLKGDYTEQAIKERIAGTRTAKVRDMNAGRRCST